MDFEASEQPKESSQPKILTVSDVNKAVKSTLENGFKLIWMKGELSNFKPHTSGHWYFSLKDSKAQISAVMFKGFNQSIKFRPRDGMEVIVRGKITVYEPRGNYQIFCEMMEPVGAGACKWLLSNSRKSLRQKVFCQRKKATASITPPSRGRGHLANGAAIRDILNVLHRRFKGLRVTVVPTVVQGEAAAPKIVEAIQLANRINDVDVIICGRGGGSVEDMWCFNDERVARAIANSRVPLISAVGHEIDFTIADFVADLRAPTPSAAAELVSRNAQEICESLEVQKRRLTRVWLHKEQLLKQRVHQLSRRLVDPKRRLQDLALRSDELAQRLEASVFRQIERLGQEIKLFLTRLLRHARRFCGADNRLAC